MSRKVFGAALMLLAVAAVADPARASHWNHPRSTSSYYYPAPAGGYYYAPIPTYVQPAGICPGPATQPPLAGVYGPGYAQPSPAPPSSTKEPPLDKKGLAPPKVIESRSFSVGDEKFPEGVEVTTKSACQVGFWNITGRDVALTVNGKTHLVRANRSLTLALSREFSWQLEGQASQKERVSDDKAAHEIVLR